MTKKNEGAKDKPKRDAVKSSLATLVGKTVPKMTKSEQETLLIVIGQVVGILDADGVVKALK